jgi:hypothetical protein
LGRSSEHREGIGRKLPEEANLPDGSFRGTFFRFIVDQIREVIPTWIRQCRVQLNEGKFTVHLVPTTDLADPRFEELSKEISQRVASLAPNGVEFVICPRGTVLDLAHSSCAGESCVDVVGPFARLDTTRENREKLTNGMLQREVLRTLPSAVELVRDYRYRISLNQGVFDFLVLRGTVPAAKEADLQTWCRNFEERYGIVVFFDRLQAAHSTQQQLRRMVGATGVLGKDDAGSVQRVIDAFYGAVPNPSSYERAGSHLYEDLRNKGFVAIDASTTRDREDVVFAERISGSPDILLSVGFIDVTGIVKPGDSIDRYAERVGSTVYGKNRTVPTLGAVTAFGPASFRLNEERPAWLIELVISPEGAVTHSTVRHGLVRCAQHLSPEGFDQIVASGAAVDTPLALLAEVADRLRGRRSEAPSLIRVSSDGLASTVVGESMIGAKHYLAKFLESSGVPAIFKVHAPPTGKVRENFVTRLHERGLTNVTSEWFDDPLRLTGLLQALEDKGERSLLHEILDAFVLRSRFDTVNVGHRGIGVDAYLEIKPREATGLKNQFQLLAALHPDEVPLSVSELQAFAERRNRQRREQPGVSYRLRFLEELHEGLLQIGGKFRSQVIAERDGKLMIEVVGFERWGVFAATPEQRERYPVGSRIAVQLDGFDIEAMRFRFSKPTSEGAQNASEEEPLGD